MYQKGEQPLDELTVQVSSLYYQPNFKYCALYVSGTKLQNQSCQKDNIARRRQPYVNSNNK